MGNWKSGKNEGEKMRRCEGGSLEGGSGNAEVGMWKWEVGMRKWGKNEGEKVRRCEVGRMKKQVHGSRRRVKTVEGGNLEVGSGKSKD